jgi:hypothetical protein
MKKFWSSWITSGRLRQRSSKNRSQSIDEILSKAKKSQLLKELEDAYTELANDPEYLSETKLWDITVGDGIDAESMTHFASQL